MKGANVPSYTDNLTKCIFFITTSYGILIWCILFR